MARDLDNQALKEYEKINYLHGLYLHQYEIDENKFRPNEFYKRAAVVIPERQFKGPLASSVVDEKMSKEYRGWMEENEANLGSYSRSKQYEIVNLMDGARSLLRIRDIISCEFDETSIEFVFRFAQELERLELVSFKIGQS